MGEEYLHSTHLIASGQQVHWDIFKVVIACNDEINADRVVILVVNNSMYPADGETFHSLVQNPRNALHVNPVWDCS